MHFLKINKTLKITVSFVCYLVLSSKRMEKMNGKELSKDMIRYVILMIFPLNTPVDLLDP